MKSEVQCYLRILFLYREQIFFYSVFTSTLWLSKPEVIKSYLGVWGVCMCMYKCTDAKESLLTDSRVNWVLTKDPFSVSTSYST